MPFSDAGRGVSARLEDFRDGDFVGVQDGMPGLLVTHLGHANRIAAGHQCRPGDSTDGLHVEIGEPGTLSGHAIEIGRFDQRRSVAADVVVALIVGEEDDEVRRPLGGGGEGRDECG